MDRCDTEDYAYTVEIEQGSLENEEDVFGEHRAWDIAELVAVPILL